VTIINNNNNNNNSNNSNVFFNLVSAGFQSVQGQQPGAHLNPLSA